MRGAWAVALAVGGACGTPQVAPSRVVVSNVAPVAFMQTTLATSRRAFAPAAWLVRRAKDEAARAYCARPGRARSDFDGDGYEDLALRLESEGNAARSAVAIFRGGPWGLSHVPEMVIRSLGGEPITFPAIGTAGDLDGDGRDELWIGDATMARRGTPMWPDPERSGEAWLLSIDGGGHPASVAAPVIGFGATIAGGSDLDGDGTPDALVEAWGGWSRTEPTRSDPGPGEPVTVYLLRGAPASSPATALKRYPTRAHPAVAVGGDVDGDGRGDAVMAFERAEPIEPARDGSCPIAEVWTDLGRGAGARHELLLAPVSAAGGDCRAVLERLTILPHANRDGLADVAVVLRGTVLVYEGRPGGPAVLPSRTLPPISVGGSGALLLAYGDFDGDRVIDLVYSGAVRKPPDGAAREVVVVRPLGERGGVARAPFVAAQEPGLFGGSFAVGDWNGDGFDDLLWAPTDAENRRFFVQRIGGPGGLHEAIDALDEVPPLYQRPAPTRSGPTWSRKDSRAR
jgi:hypothetical protein